MVVVALGEPGVPVICWAVAGMIPPRTKAVDVRSSRRDWFIIEPPYTRREVTDITTSVGAPGHDQSSRLSHSLFLSRGQGFQSRSRHERKVSSRGIDADRPVRPFAFGNNLVSAIAVCFRRCHRRARPPSLSQTRLRRCGSGRGGPNRSEVSPVSFG